MKTVECAKIPMHLKMLNFEFGLKTARFTRGILYGAEYMANILGKLNMLKNIYCLTGMGRSDSVMDFNYIEVFNP